MWLKKKAKAVIKLSSDDCRALSSCASGKAFRLISVQMSQVKFYKFASGWSFHSSLPVFFHVCDATKVQITAGLFTQKLLVQKKQVFYVSSHI